MQKRVADSLTGKIGTVMIFLSVCLGIMLILISMLYFTLATQKETRLFNQRMALETLILEKAEKTCMSGVVEHLEWRNGVFTMMCAPTQKESND